MRYPKDVQETLDKVLPIIEAAGATYKFDFANRGKHAKLHITYNGTTRMTPVACTPSRICDTIHLKSRDVRRILRELGAT